MSTPETAATRTSCVLSIIPHMRIGSMSVRAVERKSGTGTLSTEAVKARKAPAPMPGAISGRVIRRKLWRRDAPRLAEAARRAGSSCDSEAPTVRSTNGTMTMRLACDEALERGAKAEQGEADERDESEAEASLDQRRRAPAQGVTAGLTAVATVRTG